MSRFEWFHTEGGSSFHALGKPSTETNYKKMVLFLIAGITIYKCILAFVLELGNDEAYYWLYSQYLQWNYFDHPPMVAIWIRVSTLNLSLEDYPGFIRLGAVLGSALAAWFLFRTVSILSGQRAGWYAAVLYSASFYAGITAGLYILPDSPEMVFWTGSMLLIARISRKEKSWGLWILFGLVSGLCIMSKVHGIFLWVGVGCYALFRKRSWFGYPQIWLALLVSFIMISPILLWNLKYDFISYRFHSSRVEAAQFQFNWFSFGRELLNQFFFNNPVNVMLVLAGFYALARKRFRISSALYVYVAMGLPLALILLMISTYKQVTLPHWSGPAYVSFIPLAAAALARKKNVPFPPVLRWSLGIFVFAFIGWTAIVYEYPGTAGTHEQGQMGKGDISLDMYGWKEAGQKFKAFYQKEVKEGRASSRTPIVVNYWWGAHVEYYFARPAGLKVIGLGNPFYLHQYLWTNRARQASLNTEEAYCIIPSDEFYPVAVFAYENTEQLAIFPIFRGGRPAHYFRVYRLLGRKQPIPMASP